MSILTYMFGHLFSVTPNHDFSLQPHLSPFPSPFLLDTTLRQPQDTLLGLRRRYPLLPGLALSWVFQMSAETAFDSSLCVTKEPSSDSLHNRVPSQCVALVSSPARVLYQTKTFPCRSQIQVTSCTFMNLFYSLPND